MLPEEEDAQVRDPAMRLLRSVARMAQACRAGQEAFDTVATDSERFGRVRPAARIKAQAAREALQSMCVPRPRATAIVTRRVCA